MQLGIRSVFFRATLLLLAALGLGVLGPSSLEAQRFAGRVVDAATGEPLAGVLLRTTPGDFVEVTDRDGHFVFFLVGEDLPVDLTAERTSYRGETVRVETQLSDLEIRLARAPIALEGLRAEITFDQRYDDLQNLLDRRYAEFSGIVRTVGRDQIMVYDEDHDGDPYAMLSGALDLWSDFNEQQDVLRALRVPGGFTQFEVYVDDRRVPLTALTETPNASWCRAEVFYQAFFEDIDPANQLIGRDAPSQLRAYSCSYFARIAGGMAPMPNEICFGGLAAWANEPVNPSMDGDFSMSDQGSQGRWGFRSRVNTTTQQPFSSDGFFGRGAMRTCVPIQRR